MTCFWVKHFDLIDSSTSCYYHLCYVSTLTYTIIYTILKIKKIYKLLYISIIYKNAVP